jgi:hypothetical protein
MDIDILDYRKKKENMAGKNKNKSKRNRLLLKWGRLVLAIVSSIILLNKPVFNFIDEKGIVSVKTYKITTRTFEMHHVDMKTGLDELVGAMSISGLFYGALAILIGCIVCTVFYSLHRFRILICTITAFAAGTYYLIMMYYAIRLSQKFFLILYPNWVALLPVVVLVTMLWIRKDTVRRLIDAVQDEDEVLSYHQ